MLMVWHARDRSGEHEDKEKAGCSGSSVTSKGNISISCTDKEKAIASTKVRMGSPGVSRIEARWYSRGLQHFPFERPKRPKKFIFQRFHFFSIYRINTFFFFFFPPFPSQREFNSSISFFFLPRSVPATTFSP
ncbi:hypothetical protein BCR43DRAFT_187178 [Syncephalastrum racemosum]|uniref:Uncharacterized protein n=1 Tax=Syncephalastrum racemosum TaxID=13706 RepID=A0A1X2HQH6_SYNRA|nr:hypothetical protein BCR43DRAFT_187178 [Syncephalastrum racemosum]